MLVIRNKNKNMQLKNFLKGVIYASLAIVPALAWYVSESSFFPFITGKNFAFRFLIEISFVAWVALAFLDPAFRPKKSILFYSYSLFLVVICIANIFGANPYFSFFGNFERMEGWFTHLHLFLYFTVLYSVYKSETDWLRMLGWFTAGAIAVSSDAIMQLFGQKEFFLTKFLGEKVTTFVNTVYPTHMGGGLRLDSTLGNAAYYGIYALFFVFISAILAVKSNKWKGAQNFSSMIWVFVSAMLMLSQNFLNLIANSLAQDNISLAQNLALFGSFLWWSGLIAIIFTARSFVNSIAEGRIGSWPFAAFAFLNVIFVYYTQTRGSYLGLIGGIFITMLCVIIFGRNKYKKLAKVSISGVIIILFVLGLFFVTKDTSFVKNSVGLNRIATIKIPSFSNAAITLKDGNYEDLVKTFGEATIVSRVLNAGMAIEGVSVTPKTMLLGYGQENYSKVFAEHYDPRMYAQEAWFDRAHNVFMDWLVAGGVLGLIAYLTLYMTPIYMMWAGRGKENIHLIERSLLTGTLAAYFIHNIFVFDNLISYIIFIALLAYIAARTRISDSQIKVEDKNIHIKEKKLSDSIIVLGISFAATLSFVLFVYTVWSPLKTNLDIISAFKAFPTNYTTLTASTTESYKKFSTAYSRNTFGSTEAIEQMLQKSTNLAQIDFTKIATSSEIISAKVAANEFKVFAEQAFIKWVKDSPTARNTSFYGSYLRQAGDNVGALKYLEEANKISPTKQAISFEYAAALAANGKNDTAIAIVKKAYESDTSYKQAKDMYEAMVSAHNAVPKTTNANIKSTDPKVNINFKK